MKAQIIQNESALAVLKDSVKKVEKAALYVLSGGNLMYKKQFLKVLEEGVFEDPSEKDWNYNSFYGNEDAEDGSSVFDACYTAVFGGALRMVVVNGYTERKADKDEFIHYAGKQMKSTVLVLTTDEDELKKDIIFKALGEKTNNIHYIHFPKPQEGNLKNWLRTFFSQKGKTISREAVDYLVDNVGLDFETISSEASKILSFHTSKESLDIDDIRDFAHTTKIDVGFQLADSIINRNASRAYTLLHKADKSIVEIVNMLITKFIGMYKVKLVGDRKPNDEIAKILGIKSGAVYYAKKDASGYTLDRLSKIITVLYDMNIKLVTQPAYANKARLDKFIFNITRE